MKKLQLQRVKTMCSVIIGTIILLVAQGCSTSGNQKLKDQSQSGIDQIITTNKSTRQDVRNEFGDPYSSITTDDGTTIWIYRYQHAKPWVRDFIPIYNLFDSGSDVSITELIVSFNASGVVKKSEIRHVFDTTKRGITVQ